MWRYWARLLLGVLTLKSLSSMSSRMSKVILRMRRKYVTRKKVGAKSHILCSLVKKGTVKCILDPFVTVWTAHPRNLNCLTGRRPPDDEWPRERHYPDDRRPRSSPPRWDHPDHLPPRFPSDWERDHRRGPDDRFGFIDFKFARLWVGICKA